MRPLSLAFLTVCAGLSLATLLTSRTLWDDRVVPVQQVAQSPAGN